MKSILLKSILGLAIGAIASACIWIYFDTTYWDTTPSGDLYANPSWKLTFERVMPVLIALPILGLLVGFFFGFRNRK